MTEKETLDTLKTLIYPINTKLDNMDLQLKSTNAKLSTLDSRITTIEIKLSHLEHQVKKGFRKNYQDSRPDFGCQQHDNRELQINAMQTDIDILSKVVFEHSEKLKQIS